MADDNIGNCSKCPKEFCYLLFHNGFNESAYAYCDKCGKTAVLSGWFDAIPAGANLKIHQKISAEIEPYLKPCECGGHFTQDASPRCPRCLSELSAIEATDFIERNALGTEKGWRWQQNWDGIYCVAIEDNVVNNNWS